MSKASARHAKRGVNNRKFAERLAAKKQKNIDKQVAAEQKNRDKCAELRIVLQNGETPSRALRRYRREQDGIKLSAARAERERIAEQQKEAHEAFMKSLGNAIEDSEKKDS